MKQSSRDKSSPLNLHGEISERTKRILTNLSHKVNSELNRSGHNDLGGMRWNKLWLARPEMPGTPAATPATPETMPNQSGHKRDREDRRIAAESKNLLYHQYQTNDLAQCCEEMLYSEKKVVDQLARKSELIEEKKQPTQEEVFGFIQDNHLAKAGVDQLNKLLGTPDYSYASFQKEMRKIEAENVGVPTATPGQRGYCYSLKKYLSWYFKQKPPKEGEKVPIKVSFDNATVTTSHKVKVETAVFEDMREPTKKQEMNGFHFVIFVGHEDRDTLVEELTEVGKEIEELNAGCGVSFEGPNNELRTAQVEIILVCDLVALCFVLGLTAVYNHQSFWKCPWCEVTREELGDFTRTEWPLRDFQSEEYKEFGAHAERLKRPKKYARNHKGIMVSDFVFSLY